MPYNQAVRRILAIALALLIGLPAVSPLFALSTSGDATRPACCRRDGKHHCMLADMMLEARDGGAAAPGVLASEKRTGTRLAPANISERCPYGARTLPGATHPEWTPGTAAAIFAGIVAHPAVSPQTESKRRIAADRSRQKRGPPSQNS